jgi:hypothetical protein
MKPPVHAIHPARMTACLPLALAALGLACGSSADETGQERPSAEPAPVTSSMTTSRAAPEPAPGASSMTPSQPSSSPSVSPASSATAPVQPSLPNPPQQIPEQPSAPVAESCAAFGAGDACAACVCERCQATLRACAETPGCPEILACVRESGCSGRDCFCGDANLAECLRGKGNGPCHGVTLAAPGGKELSAADPSAGPASDSALAVSRCAQDGDQCSELCTIVE